MAVGLVLRTEDGNECASEVQGTLLSAMREGVSTASSLDCFKYATMP